MSRIHWLAWLWLGISGFAVGADFSFGRPVRVSPAFNSFANVAIGDVDGDGRDDLVATRGVGENELSLFLQSAGGSLGSPVTLRLIPASNAHTVPVAVIDLDRDGRGEILAGTASAGFQLIRFSGSGGLIATTHASRYGCRYLATGDVDGDGRADVVCHDWKETATVFYGDGSGGFRSWAPVRTPVGTYSYQYWKGLRLADVTGDGRLDLLVTASDVNSFSVLPNNGMGGFWPATVYTHPKSAAHVWSAAVEVLDLDGDGVEEVVTASPEIRPGAMLNVYRRGPDGYLSVSERIPLHDSPTALVADDVNGDGDAELLVGHFSFHKISVLGAGSRGLASQARYDLPGFGNDIPVDRRQGHSNGIAMGDLDGDGCRDLAAATYSGLAIIYGCRPYAERLPVSDFDGDGVSDLLWRSEAMGENFLWQWADVAAWHVCADQMAQPACPPIYRGSDWKVQAVGDFDGDGSSDPFWRNTTTGANEVWNRVLFPRTISAVTAQEWQVVAAGDFNGDDRSDLLWRHARFGANSIWLSANVTTQQTMATVGDARWKVAGVGDFDGDGRSDVLWRHASTGQNEIWRSARQDLPLPATDVLDLRWMVAGIGDFNGDGKDDVVWRHSANGANAIWLSADSARTLPMTHVPNLAWRIGAVGDYDGDGRADLLWRHGGGINEIWRSADSRRKQAVAAMDPSILLVR